MQCQTSSYRSASGVAQLKIIHVLVLMFKILGYFSCKRRAAAKKIYCIWHQSQPLHDCARRGFSGLLASAWLVLYPV